MHLLPKTTLVIFIFSCTLTSLHAQLVTSELIDRYMDEIERVMIDTSCRHTTVVFNATSGEGERELKENVSFRYLNDSVIEQRFHYRLHFSKHYFLLKDSMFHGYDEKRQKIVMKHSYYTTSRKDSCGYIVSYTYHVEGKDTADKYWNRAKKDLLGRTIESYSWGHFRLDAHLYRWEYHGDSVVQNTFKVLRDSLIPYNRSVTRTTVSQDGLLKKVTTAWINYTPESYERAQGTMVMITSYVRDDHGRLIRLTDSHYYDFDPEVKKDRMVEIEYKELH